MKNNLKHRQIRVIIFKESGIWYGAALEFNIVESGDDPREVMLFLDEAIRGYIKSAKKTRLFDDVLNQKTDSEYEKLWQQAKTNKLIKSPFEIYSLSSISLATLMK